MLHDGVTARTTDGTEARERRRHDRVPFPAEVTLLWHHAPETILRYRTADASDGGLRIRSAAPLLEGMTGIALRLLPQGKSLERPVMVVWCRREDVYGQYEAGLRFMT